MPHQQLFFSTIEYGVPYHILHPQQEYLLHKNLEILLVTGIANIEPLKKHIVEHSYSYENLSFSDHHIFTIDDLKEIRKRFSKLDHEQKVIITTEKDAVRLVKFREELERLPLFVLPIRHRILFNQEAQLNTIIVDFIQRFPKK